MNKNAARSRAMHAMKTVERQKQERERINNECKGTTIQVRCDKCQTYGAHLFKEMHQGFFVAYKTYTCSNCGAEIKEDGTPRGLW